MSKYFKYLKEKCEYCGYKLIADYDTPASDHPELSTWRVDCVECEITIAEHPTTESLLKDYSEE